MWVRPPTPTPCLMKKIALVALGALAITGCDFAGGDAFSVALPVASIQSSDLVIPADAADADGRADMFVEIQNAAGQTMWRSETRMDADPSEAASFSVPEAVNVAASTQGVTVAVWDYDTSYTDSQLISRSQAFTADQLVAQPELSLGALDSRGREASGSFTVSSR